MRVRIIMALPPDSIYLEEVYRIPAFSSKPFRRLVVVGSFRAWLLSLRARKRCK
jgi:hypothetical protein